MADESADARDAYGFRVMGSDGVRLEACEAYRAGRHHFGVINSTNFVGEKLHCALAMPDCPGGATFYGDHALQFTARGSQSKIYANILRSRNGSRST